jgi:predicted transcriptional regulator
LVTQWQLKDDSSNVLMFNQKGELAFMKQGKLSDDDVTTLINTIRAQL